MAACGLRPDFLLSLVLVLGVAVIYGQTATFEFVNFDDDLYVTDNPMVQQGLTRESIRWAFANIDYVCWQPLTWLSHMLDWELFGAQPVMHHLMNVGWHAVNAMLLFLWLRSTTGDRWRSFVIAALFAWHPLAVDTVAWVAERKNVLSTFFLLLSLGAYSTYAQRARRGWLLASLACFAAGLLTKPMLISLTGVLLLMDIWPLRRTLAPARSARPHGWVPWVSSNAGLLREKLPFVVLTAAYLGFFFFSLGRMHLVAGAAPVPWGLRLANAAVSYIAYIGHMLWPQGLAVYYPFPSTIPPWKTILCTLALLGATALALQAARPRPWLFVGWFWFIGTLVPVIGLVQGGLWPQMADRWAYVPMIGLFILAVYGAGEVAGQWKIPDSGRIAAAALVLSVLAVGAHFQARHWRDSIALFQRALAVTAPSAVAHDNLGLALALRGRLAEAKEHFTEALRLDPRYAKSLHNLGAVFLLRGDLPRAWDYLNRALELDPRSERIHNNLGRICLQQGDVDCAIAHFNAALALQPDYASARENLRRAQEHKGNADRPLPR